MQIPLIHEDFYDALGTCIRVLGGNKAVGVMLRPEYKDDPDKAARWLLACLNERRDEKLSWDQTFAIMRAAKAKGCHVAMAYISQQIGYADPQPIEPRDEMAELQKQGIEAMQLMKQLAARMERLMGGSLS